jgi:hypothetical protein
MLGSSESWGLNSTHIFGTDVPVEEPSTASRADIVPTPAGVQDVVNLIGLPKNLLRTTSRWHTSRQLSERL